MKTNIYALTENDGKVRYIGKTTKTLSVRLYQHLAETKRNTQTHKTNWIKSLLLKGYLPNIQLIGEAEGSGGKEESAWIKYFRDEGVKLVNQTDGGDGPAGRIPWNKGNRLPKEYCEKLKEAALKRSLTEEGRRRLRFARSKSLGNTGKTHSEKSRLKMSLSATKRGNIYGFQPGHKYCGRKIQFTNA